MHTKNSSELRLAVRACVTNRIDVDPYRICTLLENGAPLLDDRSDVQLLDGYENATHTVFTFRRPLISCDTKHDLNLGVRIDNDYDGNDDDNDNNNDKNINKSNNSNNNNNNNNNGVIILISNFTFLKIGILVHQTSHYFGYYNSSEETAKTHTKLLKLLLISVPQRTPSHVLFLTNLRLLCVRIGMISMKHLCWYLSLSPQMTDQRRYPPPSPLQVDTTRLIWALHPSDPAAGGAPSYHGPRRGVRSVSLDGSGVYQFPTKSQSESFIIGNTDTQILDQGTHYHCEIHKMPDLGQTIHYTGVS